MNHNIKSKLLTFIFIVIIFIPLTFIYLVISEFFISICLEKSTYEENITGTSGEKYGFAELGYACPKNYKKLSECKRSLWLIRDVNEFMYRDLVNAYEEHEGKFELVCLYSPGGEYEAGKKIADFLAEKGATTCMADVLKLDKGAEIEALSCSSMCPYILVSAASRKYIGVGTSPIKVHRLGWKIKKDCWYCPSTLLEPRSYYMSLIGYTDILAVSAEQDKSKFDKLHELTMSVSYWGDIRELSESEIKESHLFNK